MMHLKLRADVTRKSYQAFSSAFIKREFASRSHTADPDIHSGQQKPGYTNYRNSPQVITTNIEFIQIHIHFLSCIIIFFILYMYILMTVLL